MALAQALPGAQYGVPQPTPSNDDLTTDAHRQLIGYLGLGLPLILVLIAAWRPSNESSVWRLEDSISAYYYTASIVAFVGVLVALALFLLAYRGFANRYQWADRWASRIAGVAALGVALFPTRAPIGVPQALWWTETTGAVHYGSAIILFTMFAVFSLWLFRLTSASGQVTADKRRRNVVYLACGIVIVAGMGWAFVEHRRGGHIFWPESLALFAFAISWLTKGAAEKTIAEAVRSRRPIRTAGPPGA